jgi:signal transduction histidine kinase
VALRLRLTLWYSTVLALIIALFGAAVYAILTISLNSQVNHSLEEAANQIILKSAVVDIFDRQFLRPAELDQFGTSSIILAQVWTNAGILANQTQNLNLINYAEPLDAHGMAASRQSGQLTYHDVYIQGVHLKVLTRPMPTGEGNIVGYVQTATILRTLDTAQNALLIVLSAGGVGAVILAALIGWLTAGRALRPLDTITQTALQITRADDLSRRLPLLGPPKDEVGRLGMAFNESLERLERLFNAQRRFLADVSPELRTPLTAIRGNVDLLRRMGGVDPDSLDAIQSEAERMSRLVGDILLLAQADTTGHLPLARDRVELDTLLLEVFREAQVLAAGVHVGIGEIDQIVILGDRDRLKQLLLNLVSNALKFTPEGGRVTLGLCRVNEWVRLTVSDTGVGIPPADQPHVFERFYRVDKARSRALGGAGLGLSIAQRIVQMHAGRIEVSSDGIPGHGSTFSVWLPLASDKALAEPRRLAEQKSGRG